MSAAVTFLERHPALVYAGLLFVCTLIVSPIAEFPLNDDWLYAKMSLNTLDARAFIAHPFVAANATLHALWGAAVIGVFGFSFTALRLSTFVFSFAALWLTNLAAREAGATRRHAMLAGLVVIANPLVLNLTYTFMTDLIFLAMLTASTLCYLRAFRTGLARDLALGSTFGALALLVRQMGILHPAVFVIAWALTFARRRMWPTFAEAAAFALPLFIGFLLYEWGQRTSGGVYTWPNAWAGAPISIIALQIFRYVFASCIYFGLFLLPFAAAYAVWLAKHRRTWTWMRTYWAGLIVVWLLMFGCGFLLMPTPMPMPLLTNMIRDFGVGPLTLHDTTHLYPQWAPVRLGPAFWWVITALSVFSATVLAIECFSRFTGPALKTPSRTKPPVRHAQHLFLIGAAAAHLLALQNPWITVLFDRYLLPSFVPLAILAAVLLTRLNIQRGAIAALAVCAIFFAFSIVSLQDYFAWNTARWEAVEILRTKYNAADEQIEGGYEFNGMHTSDRFMEANDTTDFVEFGPYGWWTFNPQYAISFLPREGFVEIESAPYFSWLGMNERKLLILRRVPG